jgi:hypothetical protein
MRQIKSEWCISSYEHVKYIPEVVNGRTIYVTQRLPTQEKDQFIDTDGLFVQKTLVSTKVEMESVELMMEFLRQNNIAWNGSVNSNINNVITYRDGSGLNHYKIFYYNDKGEIILTS